MPAVLVSVMLALGLVAPSDYVPRDEHLVMAAAVERVRVAAETAPAPPPARADLWDRLADCETGQWIDGGRDFVAGSARWDANEGTFSGGLQFHPRTWEAFRPVEFPVHAWQATREQQIFVAERVLGEQGIGAWPRCSELLGLR